MTSDTPTRNQLKFAVNGQIHAVTHVLVALSRKTVC